MHTDNYILLFIEKVSLFKKKRKGTWKLSKFLKDLRKCENCQEMLENYKNFKFMDVRKEMKRAYGGNRKKFIHK